MNFLYFFFVISVTHTHSIHKRTLYTRFAYSVAVRKFKLLNFLFEHFWSNQMQLNRINAVDIIKINKFLFFFARFFLGVTSFTFFPNEKIILFHFNDELKCQVYFLSFELFDFAGSDNRFHVECKNWEINFSISGQNFKLIYNSTEVMEHHLQSRPHRSLNSIFNFNHNFLASTASICYEKNNGIAYFFDIWLPKTKYFCRIPPFFQSLFRIHG